MGQDSHLPSSRADRRLATDVGRPLIAELEKQMREAVKQFEFEKAAALRDRIRALKSKEIFVARG